MKESIRKNLITITGIVIIVILFGLYIKSIDHRRPKPELPVDCGDGRKVFKIKPDQFEFRYSGRKLNLGREIPDKLKSKIGVEEITLQTADLEVQQLLASVNSLIGEYNADVCGKESQARLDKIRDFVIEYGRLQSKTEDIKTVIANGSREDLAKVRMLLHERMKMVNTAEAKLK